jgi:hypothetical protein
MSDRTAAVALRILGSRSALLGTGDSDALQNVNTTNLPDGSLCWVVDQASIYALHKGSTAGPSAPTIIAPGSGPGRWYQIVTGGSGGGIPMPDGTLILPQGANFTNELGLGIWRKGSNLLGFAVDNGVPFLPLEVGTGLITDSNPDSPADVRYAARGYIPAVSTADAAAHLFVRIGEGDAQQVALYLDITSGQAGNDAPALKVIHDGAGDAMYAYVASTGAALTVQRKDSLSTTQALVQVIEQGGRPRFATYVDGATMLQGEVATSADGGTDHASPELRLYGSIWDSTGTPAAKINGFALKSTPDGDNKGVLGFYLTTPLGTSTVALLSRTNLTGDVELDLMGANSARVKVNEVKSTYHVDVVINDGSLALRVDTPGGANATALQQLSLKTAANNFTAKDVTQGASDSAGVGFTALVVPNDSDVDTSVDAGDFGTFVNLGTAPGVSVAAGSTCRRGRVTITPDAAGGGPAPGWSFILTFPVAFAATPFAICARNDTNNPPVVTSMQVSGLATTTTLTFSELGSSAPTAGVAYQFTWMVME